MTTVGGSVGEKPEDAETRDAGRKGARNLPRPLPHSETRIHTSLKTGQRSLSH